MKKNEFRLIVAGIDSGKVSDCSAEFDGTQAQLMDAVSAALCVAEKSFVEKFGNDVLPIFKDAIVEFMDDGFAESGKALRNIVERKMRGGQAKTQREKLAELVNSNEEIKKLAAKLLKELKKAGEAND